MFAFVPFINGSYFIYFIIYLQVYHLYVIIS